MFSRLAEIATALSSARLIHRNFTLRHFRYDSNNRIVLSGLGYTLFVVCASVLYEGSA